MKTATLFITIMSCAAVLATGCKKNPVNDPVPAAPTVATVEAATDITSTGATTGGEVLSEGDGDVIWRGVCWSTSPHPTVSDNKTSDGGGAGKFTSLLTGLTPETVYYVRAYAVSSVGTSYGDEITFGTVGVLMDLAPGTLQEVLETLGLEDAESLTLGGTIDQRDFAYMKSMVANRSLSAIDLSGVRIAANGDYPADEIPSGAFDGASKLTSFVFPAGVTSIGGRAFISCNGLTGSLTIPDKVQTIGERAFYGCSGFTGSLTIGDKVQTIGERAFYGCSGFTGSLTIGGKVESIGECAFSRCSGFTGSLTIPDGVTSIGNYAFEHCYGFTGLTAIPAGITSISEGVFACCSGFSGTLTIPARITSVGSYAFYECNALSDIKVEWETPITYTDYMLPTGTGITVLVPQASVAAYTAATGWKNHTITGY